VSTETAAILDKVSYLYPRSEKPALSDISLEIRKGEFLGLIGPTGAGKTTLCLVFNGIVPQFQGGRFFGRAIVAGLDTLEHPISKLARHVGVVFQDPETQLIATSVENEIAFALENLSVPRDEIRKRIPQVLAAVRLDGTEHKHPHELSGGQKQRLALAAALAVQPDLLILDEPTSQLDPVGAAEVFTTVRELNKELGITIVMASHAAEEMAEHADRIALMYEGRILALDTPDAIYSRIHLLYEHDLRPPQVSETFHLIDTVMDKHYGHINSPPVRLSEGIPLLDTLSKRCEIVPPNHTIFPLHPGREPALSVKGLTYTYPDGTQALRDVSFDICKGEYVLIIGQNGAGKSTLVKHFLKLLKPTEGTVLVEGISTEAFSTSDLAQRIGYIAQNPDTQIFSTTVQEEVSFALHNLGYSAEEIEARTAESLKEMGLLEVQGAHPLSLSKSDRARVVIAAVLAMKPEIIIFDEPTTGQDFRGARSILEISRTLHRLGKTVLVITHHLYLMPEYAERVIVMGKGTILLDAPIREAFHEVDLLRSTFLMPPQAVMLARQLDHKNEQNWKLLTPQEIAHCFNDPACREKDAV